MRTIYLDCGMGASGDMLMGALYELLADKAVFLEKMAALSLPHIQISAEPSSKCGIAGTHMRVLVHGEEESVADCAHSHTHHGASLNEILALIDALNVSDTVRADMRAVYRAIAEAESLVHGAPIDKIHFHEVGSLDALADVAGVCVLFELLAPEQVICSPICVGSGQVRCAHGLLPVPAPATALLLEGLPIYGGTISGELCTPTGAALLRHFATGFGQMPLMRPEKTGYGMGTKDFPAANCVRAMLGQTDTPAEQICVLSCNLDDMTPETIAFAAERLFDAGALDVYTTPIGMKKSRAAVMLSCICRPAQQDALTRLIFLHTTTLGVRAEVCARYALSRRTYTVQTPDGAVRVKESTGYDVRRRKAEYDDLAEIARKTGRPIADILTAIDLTDK